jgi:hypothetical protein
VLYVADTNLGRIWRIAADGATVWAEHPLLAPLPDFFPGPNGLQIFRDEVYVAVSDRAHIVAFPILEDGSAGTPRVHATGVGLDDFAFDVNGDIYGTTDPFNTLVRVSPGALPVVLLTDADGLDGPTAAVFGRREGDNQNLYVTNGAFPFFSTTFRPSILRVAIGVPGQAALGLLWRLPWAGRPVQSQGDATMKKRSHSKLILSTESLRILNPGNLRVVCGGTQLVTVDDPITRRPPPHHRFHLHLPPRLFGGRGSAPRRGTGATTRPRCGRAGILDHLQVLAEHEALRHHRVAHARRSGIAERTRRCPCPSTPARRLRRPRRVVTIVEVVPPDRRRERRAEAEHVGAGVHRVERHQAAQRRAADAGMGRTGECPVVRVDVGDQHVGEGVEVARRRRPGRCCPPTACIR